MATGHSHLTPHGVGPSSVVSMGGRLVQWVECTPFSYIFQVFQGHWPHSGTGHKVRSLDTHRPGVKKTAHGPKWPPPDFFFPFSLWRCCCSPGRQFWWIFGVLFSPCPNVFILCGGLLGPNYPTDPLSTLMAPETNRREINLTKFFTTLNPTRVWMDFSLNLKSFKSEAACYKTARVNKTSDDDYAIGTIRWSYISSFSFQTANWPLAKPSVSLPALFQLKRLLCASCRLHYRAKLFNAPPLSIFLFIHSLCVRPFHQFLLFIIFL